MCTYMILINTSFFRGAPIEMAINRDCKTLEGACLWCSVHYKLAREERKHKEKMMTSRYLLMKLSRYRLNSIKLFKALLKTPLTTSELTRFRPLSQSPASSLSLGAGVRLACRRGQWRLRGTPLGLCIPDTISDADSANILLLNRNKSVIICLRLAHRDLGWRTIRHDIGPNVVVSPHRRCGSAFGCPAPIPSLSPSISTWLGRLVSFWFRLRVASSRCPRIQDSDNKCCDSHIHDSTNYDYIHLGNDASSMMTDQLLHNHSYLYDLFDISSHLSKPTPTQFVGVVNT